MVWALLKILKDKSCNEKNGRSGETGNNLFETNKNFVMQNGKNIFNTESDMAMAKMCEYPQ